MRRDFDMKKIFFKKLNRNKKGASLPMVIAVGTAVVMWTVALMPVMLAHGLTANQASLYEENYVDARSAIEYAKSELAVMVATGLPENFAVLKGDEAYDFETLIKSDDETTYNKYVIVDGSEQTGGTPRKDEFGNKVAAICHVKKPGGNSKEYKITVECFNNGSFTFSYTVDYVPSNTSLMIYPESYKKSKALPLSDFVLVDGKLGASTVWESSLIIDSSLTYDNYFEKKNNRFTKYSPSFTETLLSLEDGKIMGDALNFPAVFKTTAIAPPITGDVANPSTGNVGWTVDNKSYLSSVKIESAETVDLDGTLFGRDEQFEVKLTEIKNNDKVRYGISTKPDGSDVVWQTSNVFYPDRDGTSLGISDDAYCLYFYCYIPAYVDETTHTIRYDAEVKYVGRYQYFDKSPVATTLEAGKQYMLLGNNKSYYLTIESNSLKKKKAADKSTGLVSTGWIADALGNNKYTLSYGGVGLKSNFSVSYDWDDELSASKNSANNTSKEKEAVFSYSLTTGAATEFTYYNNTLYSSHEYTRIRANYVKKSKKGFLGLSTTYYYEYQSSSDEVIGTGTKDFYVKVENTNALYDGSSKNVYFVEITEGNTSAIEAAIADRTITKKNLTRDEGITLKEIAEFYTSEYNLSELENLKIYLDESPIPEFNETTAPTNGSYTVLASYNENGYSHVIELGALTITDKEVNNRVGSGIKGESLYFMGSEYAFDTGNTRIYLEADLLVIGSKYLAENGEIHLKPYTNRNDNLGTLAFFVQDVYNANGEVVFEKYNFYVIPTRYEDVDLLKVTPEKASDWKCRDSEGAYANGTEILTDNKGNITSVKFANTVIGYANDKLYPVINLDIAYASQEQLAHIISGEAIGWTKNGVMQSGSSNSAIKYVVCAYLTDTAGDSTRTANRILIAGKPYNNANPDDKTIGTNISHNLTLYSRYTSFDCYYLVQNASGVKLDLHTITENKDNLSGSAWEQFVNAIKNYFGVDDYSSKTMQVDFERITYIVDYSHSENKDVLTNYKFKQKPEIVRYESGIDLFASAETAKQSLQVTYTADDLNNKRIAIAERYLRLTGGTSGILDITKDHGGLLSSLPSKINFYANYVVFDKNVNQIEFSDVETQTGIYFYNQESGYTEEEYLIIFTYNTAEFYTGVLLHFEDDVVINNTVYEGIFSGTKVESYTIPKGFYFIEGIDIDEDNGFSLLDLAKNPSAYHADESTFDDYTGIIDRDGSMGYSFVDTGIFDGTPGASGFGGGKMQ